MRLGVLQQQVVDLLSAGLLGGCRCANVYAWCLVAATAQECNGLDEDTTSLRSYNALLNLSAFDACEGEKFAAHVVEYLDGVAVESIDLVAQFEQSNYRVRIGL